MESQQPFKKPNPNSTTTFTFADDESSEDQLAISRRVASMTTEKSTVQENKDIVEYIFRVAITTIGFLILLFLFYKSNYTFENIEGKNVSYSFFTILLFFLTFLLGVFLLSFFIYYFKHFLVNLVKNKKMIGLFELNPHFGIFVMLAIYIIVFNKSDFYFIKNSFAKLSLLQILYVLIFSVFFCALAKFSILNLRTNYDFTNFYDRIKKFYLQSLFIDILNSDSLDKLKKRINFIKYERLFTSLHSKEFGFRGEEVNELTELIDYLNKTPGFDISPHEKPTEFSNKVWLLKTKIKNKMIDHLREYFYPKGNLEEVISKDPSIFQEKRTIKIAINEVKYGYISLFDFLAKLIENENTLFYELMVYLKVKEDDEKFIARLIDESYKENFYLKNNIKKMQEASDKFLTLLYFFIFTITLALFFLKASGDIKVATGFFSTTFSFSLIFHTTLINTINNLIFIFNMHPYDIGDRVIIYFDNEDHNLVVTEFNINTTNFIRFDGTQIQIANHVLLRKMIVNISRSGQQLDTLQLQVSHFIPSEKIANLTYQIKCYILSNSEIFTHKFHLFYDQITDCNKLNIIIYVQFKKNWHNWEKYLEKRSMFIKKVNDICISNGIEYKYLPIPVYLKEKN